MSHRAVGRLGGVGGAASVGPVLPAFHWAYQDDTDRRRRADSGVAAGAGRGRRAVQARREWPVRVIQWVQGQIQRRIMAAALRADRPFRLPLAARLLATVPGLRWVVPAVVGWGVRPARLRVPVAP